MSAIITSKEVRKSRVICERCFADNGTIVENRDIEFHLNEDDINSDKKLDHRMNYFITGSCYKCKIPAFFMIVDDLIADVVITLCKKGYYVTSCSAGDQTANSVPHIIFKNNGSIKDESELAKNLPEEWRFAPFVNHLKDSFNLIVKFEYRNRSYDVSKLQEWADSLPDKEEN